MTLLHTSKKNFYSYYYVKWDEELEQNLTNGLSIRAEVELVEIFEDGFLKMNFNWKYLINF